MSGENNNNVTSTVNDGEKTNGANNVDSKALAEKIIKQVEYYFGDINLNKDKFMQEESQKDSGWIPLETLTKFNRLRSLSTDHQVIIDALKQSTSNLLEIDEENKKVRRAKPLPENLSEFETTLKQNTVYVKGFPNTMSLDELDKFFEAHGNILQIFMRRFPSTRQFKGSVFVTFQTNEQMKAFLELPEVKYQDQVLQRESQEDYFKRKGPEIEKAKAGKQKREQEREEKKKQKLEAEEAYLKELQIPGAVIHLKGFNSEANRESLKELFDSHAKVKWLDYSKGQAEGYVRFAEANTAKDALAKAIEANNGELKLKEATLEARVLEGEEENNYWKEVIRAQAESRNKKANNRKNRNKRGGGGGKKRDYKNKGKKRSLDGDGDDDDGEENDDGDDDDDDNNENENDDKNESKNKLEEQESNKNDQEVLNGNSNKKLKV